MRPSIGIRRCLCVLGFALACAHVPALAQTVVVRQVDFDLDGVLTPDSDWGVADLTLTVDGNPHYFNLAIDGTWQVQDMPVMDLVDIGATQTLRFWFSLNVPPGVDVPEADVAWTLTASPTGLMPTSGSLAPVAPAAFVLAGGDASLSFPDVPAPAEPLIGGPVDTSWKASPPPEKAYAHAAKNFPNQDCEERECVPTAVSNSLKYLNSKHNMGLPDSSLSIAKMKEAVGYGPKVLSATMGPGVDRVLNPWPAGVADPCTIDGAYNEHDDTAAAGERKAWWEVKRDYLRNKGIPVTTRKFSASDIGRLGAELDAGQAIEMTCKGHTTNVVGIQKLNNGKYALSISHDTQQSWGGGTVAEPSVWNPATKRWEGALTAIAADHEPYFVVQCPRNRGVGGTYTATTDPDTTRPPYGGWTPTSGHGTTFPDAVGESIFLGKNNLACPFYCKTWTITLKGTEAHKYDARAVVGYTKGANTSTSLKAEVTSTKDVPGTPPKRVITASIFPQPDWEKVRIERTAAKARGVDAVIEVHTSTHCQSITKNGSLLQVVGYPGVLDEAMHVTEVQVFFDSAPIDTITGTMEFFGPEGSGPWEASTVFVDPEGEPRPLGGVRWRSLGDGILAEQDYRWLVELEGPAEGLIHVYLQNAAGEPGYEYEYYLMEVDALSTTPVPAASTLAVTVAPNPFNALTEIGWELPTAGRLELRIFDVRGRLLRTLVDAERPAGPGSATWNGRDDAGRDVSSGIYLYRARCGERRAQGKVALVR